MKRIRNRSKSTENNLLFTTTSRGHQRKKLIRWGLWLGILILTLSTVGVGTHFAAKFLMQRLVYENPRYALKEVRVEVKGSISRKQILQAARIGTGQNVMTLDLRRIQQDVEHLPYVAEAQVVRLLPDKIMIRVTERVPVARITAHRSDLNMRELLYLDRDGIVIKPQSHEMLKPVPEIMGGKFADLEPGQRLDQAEVLAALQLMKQFDLTPLKATMDIHHFDVSRPMTLVMVAQDGLSVSFRLDRIELQLERLREILEFAGNRERQLATIDLTPEFNVPATFRN